MENNFSYPNSRWLVLFIITFSQVVIGSTLICMAPILGIISKDIGVSVGEITAAAMGSVIMASAISAMVSGPIIDKFGAAKSITVGLFITTVGMALIPVLDNSIKEIVLVRVFTGIGWGPVSACTSSVAARWFPKKERGLLAGMVGAGISIGIIIGFMITPKFLAATAHWSDAVQRVAVIPAIAFVLAFLMNFLKDPQIKDKLVGQLDSSKMSQDISLAFKSLPTYMGILCMFLFTWIMNAFNDLTPGFIAIAPPVGLGLGPALAGKFMSAVQVGMLLGSIACGFILTAIFKGRIKPLLLIGFICSGLLMFSVRFECINSMPQLFVGCLFLAGFFEAFIIPMVTTFIAMNYPAHITGRIFGLTFGISLFGGSVGVFVGSTFLHITGNYMASINVVAIVALLGLIPAFLMNPPKAFKQVEFPEREKLVSQSL